MGLLTNLKIIGMEDPDGLSFSIPMIFEAMFNPVSYTVNHKLNFDTKKAAGSEGGEPEYKNTESETFTLEFMIDGTGASKPSIPIIAQVTLFNTVTTKMSGKTHRPNYLIVQWGSFIRECVLQTATITYTLFSQEGIPLRAKINATFLERAGSKINEMASMLSSPDLTHTIETRHGDLLPLLTYKIYRDQKYYIQVARANKLKNFRELKPGNKINFPPLA